MNSITKVSDLTVADLGDYLRLPEITVDDQTLLETMINAAKSYVVGYTGLTAAQLDEHQDIVIAVLVLCQDMYDNRTYYVDNAAVNKVVDTILGMHRVNLL